MEGRESEGMREVEGVLGSQVMVLCGRLLLVYAHRRCKTIGESLSEPSVSVCSFYC